MAPSSPPPRPLPTGKIRNVSWSSKKSIGGPKENYMALPNIGILGKFKTSRVSICARTKQKTKLQELKMAWWRFLKWWGKMGNWTFQGMTIYLFIYLFWEHNSLANPTHKAVLVSKYVQRSSQLCQGFRLLTSEIEQGTFEQRILDCTIEPSPMRELWHVWNLNQKYNALLL